MSGIEEQHCSSESRNVQRDLMFSNCRTVSETERKIKNKTKVEARQKGWKRKYIDM